MTPHQEISSPGPQRANQLGNNNKQSAPVTRIEQRELPGIRKTVGQPENEFIHFLVCPAFFRCALCAQRASEAGCLEAVDCVIQATAGSCLLSKLRNIRHWRVQGGTPTLVGFGATPQRPLSLDKFLFCGIYPCHPSALSFSA